MTQMHLTLAMDMNMDVFGHPLYNASAVVMAPLMPPTASVCTVVDFPGAGKDEELYDNEINGKRPIYVQEIDLKANEGEREKPIYTNLKIERVPILPPQELETFLEPERILREMEKERDLVRQELIDIIRAGIFRILRKLLLLQLFRYLLRLRVL
ncbi:hypothetical protein Moror_8404 [Moniliophthora roreri MCA 2997]|uniref:Uncharacterized protein n=1 Tax=Moniliophthora roreri (strain MCA 2997) TaxID=1381753 RepID=V2YRB3_MONRO|nr:hypothetical protein Moror_8404 [Moniliophthora roreri MCA 2997]KAI3619213.1 hypothetical protein WG66_012668 [Moniliophthora roreri]